MQVADVAGLECYDPDTYSQQQRKRAEHGQAARYEDIVLRG
jgi:hypothetical protein